MSIHETIQSESSPAHRQFGLGAIFWWFITLGMMLAYLRQFDGAAVLIGASVVIRLGGDLAFDLICAPVVGTLVGVLIEAVLWVERNSKIPRHMTASWLLSAVIAGNLLVPFVLA